MVIMVKFIKWISEINLVNNMNNDNYKINASVVTHKGKVRKNNEDNFYFFDHILDNTLEEVHLKVNANTKNTVVFGVFDGMGGHEHGEKASAILANMTKEREFHEEELEEQLLEICNEANLEVCDLMREYRVRIGSTASFIALHKNNAYTCNIGDTPVYLYHNGELLDMYEEHTERRMYERLYGFADAKKKYRLTQNIGVFEEEMMIKPYTQSFEIQKGDILIICSDGLTDMVDKETICSILDNHKENREIILRDKALENGGRDNITIILIEVENKKLFGLFDL